MNKRQLASKIWNMANKLRSKIEANEYKDFILGFIFYKFLSDKEEATLKQQGWTSADLPTIAVESDTETRDDLQNNLGYFIAYDNLFSTWIARGKDCTKLDITTALSAFSRLVSPSHKHLFDGIFETLQTGLGKLGATDADQSRAIRDILNLIKDIPTDDRQDYDVLGFVYEYLISMFAANAGKKAGEFYTPHEVSCMMSDIIAAHLRDQREITIYDPTSGSGGLLINIGKSVAKHTQSPDSIKYYAQELIKSTYNLSRMNLIMRGIKPDNIIVRNADTLENDWPFFDDADPVATYNPLYLDAVVSNPPYSAPWNPQGKDNDPRYSRFGLAPKGKADYAFLLHDLYHLKPHGIMTIVLPHGVLYRGGEEYTIRRNLIENHHIETIIGLPEKIFFGTGISTIVMVLKQQRTESDILFIDASRGFEKNGKNNRLRDCDIRRVTDTVAARTDIPHFARLVPLRDIQANDYNLNISRYVSSGEQAERYDIYATMFGGIPNYELDCFADYWHSMPNLRTALFRPANDGYSQCIVSDLRACITTHPDTDAFRQRYAEAFRDYRSYLFDTLVLDNQNLPVQAAEETLSADLFARLRDIPLIDPYQAYQAFRNQWTTIASDLETLQSEGLNAARQIDPNMVVKTKDGKEIEVQDGVIGHLLPLSLVQRVLLRDEYQALDANRTRITAIDDELTAIIDEFTPEEQERPFLNDDNTAFCKKALAEELKAVYADISTTEIDALNAYLTCASKADKLAFINATPAVQWNLMERAKDGTFGKTAVCRYMAALCGQYVFPDDSYESRIRRANDLLAEQDNLRKTLKQQETDIMLHTRTVMANLDEQQIYALLSEKWITPLLDALHTIPVAVIDDFINSLQHLCDKYSETLIDIEQHIREAETSLHALLCDLTGSDSDMQAIRELQQLLQH